MNAITTRVPVLHVRDDQVESRMFDGVPIYATLCDRWEVKRDFIDSAPMGGLMCAHCQRVAEKRIASNESA